MNRQISTQEWETLSAYLDGQLNDRDRRGLEARLKIRPDLRNGLEEMRRTRALLRSAPKRRAPRNFTISRAMAESYRPVRQVAPAFPIFRLASALASFLLVLVFLGDLAITQATRNLVAQAPAPPAAAVEQATAPEEPAGAELRAAPFDTPLPNDTPAPETMTLKAEAMPTLSETEQASIAMTAAPPGMGGGVPLATTEPPIAASGPAATPELLPAQPTPNPAPTATAMPAQEYFATQEGAPLAGYPPAANESQAADSARQGDGDAYPAPQTPQVFDARRLFRPIEVTLAIIALATGVTAWILRRR